MNSCSESSPNLSKSFLSFDELFNDIFFRVPSESKPPIAYFINKNEKVPVYHGSSPDPLFFERKTGFVIQFALAGFKEEGLSIWIDERTLYIKGDNIEDTAIAEKFRCQFLRKFVVSHLVDLETIQISFTDGLLEVKIFLIEESNSKRKFLLGAGI